MNVVRTHGQECCGCAACADICPMQCIDMREDAEFFIYPFINEELCIQCGKCMSVCPTIRAEKFKVAIDNDTAYAFVSNDLDVVQSSSSGGAFSTLMDAFSQKYDQYAIAGAAFDGTNVRHICVDNRKAAEAFKRSKYVQSHGRFVYQQVKEALSKGKYVLFSGTPCMVAALKAFLGGDAERLLTVDIVCHGVPSRNLLNMYLDEVSHKYGSDVERIDFRIKKDFATAHPNPRTMDIRMRNGTILNQDIAHCEYLYGFHTGLFFRPSCGRCKFTCPERIGDITLGDFWGIEKKHPQLQSKKGVSLVRFNTAKGLDYLSYLKSRGTVYEESYSFACDENEQLKKPSKRHRNRRRFFSLRKRGLSLTDAVNICKKPDNLGLRILHKIDDILQR